MERTISNSQSIGQRRVSVGSTGPILPIQLDITNACNLTCNHCYHSHHRNSGAIKIEEWREILDQYEALASASGFRKMVIISGGEPTISRLFRPLLDDMARRKIPRVVILTNGTRAHQISRIPRVMTSSIEVQVSLDGPSREDHDSVRGIGAFDATLDGIRHLRQNGLPVYLLAVLSKQTASYIPTLFDLAKSLQVQSMNFTRLIGEGFGRKLVRSGLDRGLSPLELKEAYKQIVIESARAEVPTNVMLPLYRLLHSQLGSSGRYGSGIVVDYQGYLLASSRSRIRLGHASRDGLEKVFLYHPMYKALRSGQIKVCGRCEFLSVCGGDRNAAYAEFGDYLGPDPGCWKGIDETAC